MESSDRTASPVRSAPAAALIHDSSFADWYQGLESPYYNDSRAFAPPFVDCLASSLACCADRKFRAKVRAFVEKEIEPFCHEWDEAGTCKQLCLAALRLLCAPTHAVTRNVLPCCADPPELHKKAYDAGILASMWPAEYGGTPPEGCDAFHDLILIDELSRCGAGGILW